MLTVSVQELQKRIGDVQTEAARDPVLITSHGKPRCVLLSIDEFVRLKSAAREPLPADVRRKPSFRMQPDPLGYDLADLDGAILAMTKDAVAGTTGECVQAELDTVRRRFPPSGGAQ